MGIKKQYQTIIVACAFTLLFVNTGFTSTSFSIYQSYIVDIPGVGDVGGSVVVTVRTFVSLICMFFTGVYFRRLNPRIGFFIATLFTALAFFLFGRAYSLAGLCVASAFAGIGYGFGGMVASTYLIGNWFRGKVGSVSGIATMGSGVAAIFIPILAGWLIDAFSLSLAFYVEAAIAFILALLLFKFVRVKPEDVGLEPVMARPKPNQAPKDLAAKNTQEEVAEATIEETDEQRAAASPSASEESTDHPALEQHEHGHIHKAHHAHHAHHLHRRKSIPRPRVNLASMPLPRGAYVAMIFALVLLGGVSVAGYNYFGILLTTQGVDAAVAALLISLAGIFLTVSKFVVGIVCDKFGTLTGSFCFFILLTVAMLLCALVGIGGVPEASAAAVVLGIGMPLGTTGIALWSLELSSAEQMLKTIRHFQIAYAFGGFVFNLMPGVLCELTGTYTTSHFIMMGMTIICAFIVVTVYAHHIKRTRQAVEKTAQEQTRTSKAV